MLPPPTTVDELLGLFELADRTLESEEVDEPVGFGAHGLQCAMALRRVAREDTELQVAGLVHDLGHLVAVGDPDAHGRGGARLVAPLLGGRVAALVELHVPAKRYLVATDARYRQRLTPTSDRTLVAQGGPMTDTEVRSFVALPHAPAAVLLRRADDAAKRPDWVVPTLTWWEPIVRAVSEAADRAPG